MYQFEDEIILFLDMKELESEEFQDFKERNNLTVNDLDRFEETASIYVDKDKITIPFILELEDVLDSRITMCSRFLGSSDTIKSLGLN